MLDSMDGSGTEEDPYVITTVEELQAVKEDLSAHYELANDINSEETSKWNNGDGFNPIGVFTGTFDGNNYEIRNLCIKQPEQSFTGMFGYVGGKGRVVNLGLANASIEGGYDVGGLAGRNYGRVESSYTVKSDVSGDENVGGLIGRNFGRVESSYTVKQNVSGDKSVDGLVGWSFGMVNLSYTAEVDLSGNNSFGGLVVFNSTESESSLVLSNSEKGNVLEDADLVLLRRNHRISYVVETGMLCLRIDDEIYSGKKVSPIKVQSLLKDTEVVKMTDRFRSSVVASETK